MTTPHAEIAQILDQHLGHASKRLQSRLREQLIAVVDRAVNQERTAFVVAHIQRMPGKGKCTGN